jgi:hypothetical protein
MAETRTLVVAQRYGDVAGGAETHARQVATRLADAGLGVEVATTTARDYWTWANEFAAGEDRVDGLRVRRFRVAAGRAADFRRAERAAFAEGHSLADERRFIDAQGPVVPDLLAFLASEGRAYDHVLFFTYIYYPTAYGLPLVPDRAVLVPTAHDEPAIRLTSYRALFHAARAIAFNTDEERAMVQRLFRNARVPNEVVGVGVDIAGALAIAWCLEDRCQVALAAGHRAPQLGEQELRGRGRWYGAELKRISAWLVAVHGDPAAVEAFRTG